MRDGTCRGIMGTIFISHSSADNEIAEQLGVRLRALGYASLFLDFDAEIGIPAGRNWEQELYRQLLRSDALIFLASGDSVASKWCFTELAIARSLGKQIFPVGIGVDAHPLLSEYQWIDLEKKDGETAFARLWPALASVIDPLESIGWKGDSPYPGLAAFDADRAGVFFGRTSEIRELCDRLRAMARETVRTRALAILGASGSGKSSLVRAGVVPRLTRTKEWIAVPPFAPRELGATPLEAMSRKLASSLAGSGPWRSIHNRIRADARELPSMARDLIDRASGTGRHLLLVLDQAEELLSCSQADQQAFLDPLLAALQNSTPLTLLLTMRSEFLPAAMGQSSMAELLRAHGPFMLAPMDRTGLRDVIIAPAKMAGAQFDDGLPEAILDDVKGGDALPLLAFTLQHLYAQRSPGGVISTDSYVRIGRFEGALRKQADEAFDILRGRGLGALVLRTLLKFADLSETGEPLRRRMSRLDLDQDENRIVDAFVDARLLTALGAEGEDPTIEVAHEALLRVWGPLSDTIDSARGDLRVRAELERAATNWDRSARDAAYLVHRGRIEGMHGLGDRPGHGLSKLAATYVQTCIQAHGEDFARADRQRRERQARALAMTARSALQEKPLRALLLAAEAVERVRRRGEASLHDADDAIAQIVSRIGGQAVPEVGSDLETLRVSRDGRHAARLREHELRVWPLGADGLAGEAVSHPLPALGPYPRIRWAGSRVLVQGDAADGPVLLVFAIGDKGRITDRARLPGSLLGAAPDGAVLVMKRADRSSQLVGVGDIVQDLAHLPAHRSSGEVVFSRDGNRFVLCDDEGGALFRVVRSGGALEIPIESRVSAGLTCRFSPDGCWLFTANTSPNEGGSGANASIWALPSPGEAKLWHSFGGRNVAIAEFSPDSRWLAFVGWNDMYQDEYVRLFRLEPTATPPTCHRLRQIEEINHLAFSADGHWIVTASRNDDNAFAWDLRLLWNVDPECAERASSPIPLGGHGRGVQLLSFANSNATIVTLSVGGVLRQFELEKQTSKRGSHLEIWRLAPSSPTTLLGHDDPISKWTISEDEQTILTAAEAGSARLWQLPVRDRTAPSDLVAEARRLAGRTLSPEERAEVLLRLGD